jgi:hypothetical protein
MHRLRLRKMGKPWPWPVGAWEVGYAAWISCSSAPSSRGLLRCNRHPRKRTGKLGEIRYLVLFCCFVLLMLLSHGADMPIGSTISAVVVSGQHALLHGVAHLTITLHCLHHQRIRRCPLVVQHRRPSRRATWC